MNVSYLRIKNERYGLSLQEKNIYDYALKLGKKIDSKEKEITPLNKSLEEREQFIEFLRSLKKGDSVFVYELPVFSTRVGELVKILNCLFKRGVDVYISKYSIKIDSKSSAADMLELLNEIRENLKKEKKKSLGRPKGSISRSKYDVFKEEIIKKLKEGKSVSTIATELGVRRTSLRDYIESRGLKEFAAAKGKGSEEKVFIFGEKRCELIKGEK
ncbi:recombinase family protein [Nitrosophilus alvini]|uniref:recombinase family protein n=1 Tax=Nitrosophilus alvini TaxID=2714855 RepID=UPI0019097B13|nr:recombinase family protein [Nitrosophilus alvini]